MPANERTVNRLKLLFIIFAILIVSLLIPQLHVYSQTPVALAPWFYQQFDSGTGVPIANGCVWTYMAGTSTPLATYTDSTGSFQNSDPIILDGGGFPPSGIWLTANAYRFVVYSSGGVNCATGTQQRVMDFVLPPPFLGANNAWTGNESHAGTETFNGAVNINGTTTFTGTVNGLPGSGTVTNFNIGNLSPLFTTSVTNPTTTPAVTFAFVTPATGTGAPVFGTAPTIGSAALTTPTIGGVTITNVPNMVWNSVACGPGACTNAQGTNFALGLMDTGGGAIVIEVFRISEIPSASGCSPYPTFVIYDETAGATITGASIALTSGTGSYAVNVTQNAPSGHVLDMRKTVLESGCTNGGLINASVTYRMQ